jgi:hypothetical protein
VVCAFSFRWMLPSIQSFWLWNILIVTVGTTSQIHLLIISLTELAYTSMLLSEAIRNISQSGWSKQSWSVESDWSDQCWTDLSTDVSCFRFGLWAGSNKMESWSDLPKAGRGFVCSNDPEC